MSEKRTNLLATTALATVLSLPGVAYATDAGTAPLNQVLSQSIVDRFIQERDDKKSAKDTYRSDHGGITSTETYGNTLAGMKKGATDPVASAISAASFDLPTAQNTAAIGPFTTTKGTHAVAFDGEVLKSQTVLETEREEAAKKALKAKLGGMVGKTSGTALAATTLATAVRGLAGIEDSASITEADIAKALDKALETPVAVGKRWEDAKIEAATALGTAESNVTGQEKDNAVRTALGALTPPPGLKKNRQPIALTDTTAASAIQGVIKDFEPDVGTVAATVNGKIKHGDWEAWRDNAGLTGSDWDGNLDTYGKLKTFLSAVKDKKEDLKKEKSKLEADKKTIDTLSAMKEYIKNNGIDIKTADGSVFLLPRLGSLHDSSSLDPVIGALAARIGNGITKDTDPASTSMPVGVDQALWDQFVAAQKLKAAAVEGHTSNAATTAELDQKIGALDSLINIKDTFIDAVTGLGAQIATGKKKTPGDDIVIDDNTTLKDLQDLQDLQDLKDRITQNDQKAKEFSGAIDDALTKYKAKKGSDGEDTDTIREIKASLGNSDIAALTTARDTARAEYHAFLARHELLVSETELTNLNAWKGYVDSKARTFEAVKSNLDGITGADQESLTKSLTDALKDYSAIQKSVDAYNALKQQYNTLRTSLVDLSLVGKDKYKDITEANITALVGLAKGAQIKAKGAELEQAAAEAQTALDKAHIYEARGTKEAPDDEPVNIGQDGTIKVDGVNRHATVNGGLHSTKQVRLGATGDGAKVVVNGEVSSTAGIGLWGDKPVEVQDTHGNIEAEGNGEGYLISTHAKTNIAPQNIGTKDKQLGKFDQHTEAWVTKTYGQFHVKEALLIVNNGGTATTIVTEAASGDILTVGKGMTVDMRGDATGLEKVVGKNDGDGTFRFSAKAGETKSQKTQLGAAGQRLGRVEFSGGTQKRDAGAPSYVYANDVFFNRDTEFEDNIAVTYSNNVTNEDTHKTNAATTVKGNYTNQGTHDINAAMKAEGNYTNDAGSTLNLNHQLKVAGTFTSGNGSQINLSAENPNARIEANSFDFVNPIAVNVSGVVDRNINFLRGSVTKDAPQKIELNVENNAYNNLLDFNISINDKGADITSSSNSAKTADLVSRSGASAAVAKAFASGLAVAEKTGDSDLRKAYETVVLSGNAADIKLAAEQSTSSSGVAATQAITGASRAAAGAVSTRLAASREGTQTAGLQQSGVAAGDDTRRNGAWMKATGGIATQKARNGVAGGRTNTYGTTIGLDNKVTETLRLGGALSYAQSDVKGKDSGQSKTDINSYQVALYGSYEPGQYFVEGQLAWAYNTIKTSRRITFGGLNRTANGEYDAQQYSASSAVGMPLHKGAVTLTPKAGMFYSYNSPSSYTETGAEGSNLTVNPPSTQILEGSLGGVVAYNHAMRSGAELRPELRAAALYEFLGDDATATAKYSGAGATIQTPGLKPSKLGGTVGAGMGYTTSDGLWEVRADYDAEMRAGYVSHNGMLTGRINF